MKSVFKRRVFIVLASLFLIVNFSCEKESISLGPEFSKESLEISNSDKYKTNLINADLTSQLSEKLNSISKKTNFKNSPSHKDDPSFWINYNSIVQLVDSVGNITYAVQLKSNQPSEKVFYNIIITERVDGSQRKPFIVKYQHDENISRVDYRNSQDKKFKGNISSYSLESFSSNIINSRGSTADPCWDDDIDRPDEDPESVGDGNTGSSSGGGGGGGASSGGFEPTGSSSVGSSRPTGISSSSGDSGTVGTVEVGEGCFCDPEQPQQKRMVNLTGRVSDCPEEEIAAPINDLPDDQEILYPDCASFEFANGLGGSVKGAQVTGVNNSFFAVEPINASTTQINGINILYPNLFFTMPAGWTNGRSATKAAEALQNSISITESWYRANPSATEAQLESVWWSNMKLAMGRVGGSVSKTPLFTVRSPAPYKVRFFGTGNCG